MSPRDPRCRKPRPTPVPRQRGAALLVMMLVMVLGTSWALVSAVNQTSRNTASEQKQTGDSLRLAKGVLLGYLAQKALTSDVPGMFPCPESTSYIGTSNEGYANSNITCTTLPAIGRLPWKTLGMGKPLDGAGEALWYVIGSNLRAAPINFSTTGSLTLDGTANAAVALIIAPGVALNTVSNSGTAPSPCVKRNQTAGRSSSPLNSADFVECGNASLSAFESFRDDTWGNDRVISITAAEMFGAIEGAVADRIQRTVAPALNGISTPPSGWYHSDSQSEWGVKFLPYASTWGDPTADDSCGNFGVTEGLLPLATGNVAVGTSCSSRWTSGSVTKVSGSGSFSFTNCIANPAVNPTRMRCTFSYSGTPVVRATVTASNIAMGFRTPPTAAQITFTPATGNTLNSLTPSIVPASGAGQVVVQATMANRSTSGTGRIFIPYPDDSYLINTNTGSNPDLAWFINNQWQRYTYYTISTAAGASPSGVCTSADVSNCLTLENALAGTGNTNDKRITLILSGRPLTGKTQPSASLGDYFEAQNDQTATPGDRTFQRGTISTTFNDRPAVCPFQQQTGGLANVLCD